MDSKSKHIIKLVKDAVNSIDADSNVVLFGSRARGDWHEESDWDFLVLTSKVIDPTFKKRIIERVLNVELEQNICVQILIKNKSDWESIYTITPLYKNIKQEGVKI